MDEAQILELSELATLPGWEEVCNRRWFYLSCGNLLIATHNGYGEHRHGDR